MGRCEFTQQPFRTLDESGLSQRHLPGANSVMLSKQIEICIEILCQKGCRSVREDIRRLEQGVELPELKMLDELACQTVLKELCAIMAVYGDRCPLPPSADIPNDDLVHGKNN
jgi:hypothetical protein